ncbi:MAG: GRAM domain-containing protein [Myxococcota bacterium]
MNTPVESGERVLRDGAANLQRGIESVGGRLTLTTARLVFESHALNVQTGTTVIPLSEIARIEPCWTKFLGLIPLAPNGLAVTTAAGVEHRFVLFGRAAWLTAIVKAKDGAVDTGGGPASTEA